MKPLGARLRRLLPPGAVLLAALPLVAPTGAPAPGAAASTATITVAPTSGGWISRGLFGANLLWPYAAGGSFDPRTDAFYPSFVSLVRRSGVSVLRYPGGTTADSFDWQRAIGPMGRRLPNEPYGVQNAGQLLRGTVRDGPVPSVVGPDEFAGLLRATGAAGTLVVNFATGTAAQAAAFVAYMTARVPRRHTTDSASPGYWAQLRAANGDPRPSRIDYVEVGNEQYVSAEYGWRSGALVRLGPGAPHCAPAEVPTCLYVFGGTTRFVGQSVGRLADQLPLASLSTGRADQVRYVYYPPVVPGSESVTVNGLPWRRVARLGDAPRGARVYSFDATTGRIAFGGGRHGAAPPPGAPIAASYESGPHAGFVEFYAAIKKMDPKVSVCATEGGSTTFLELMGRRHPYDCIEVHQYAVPTETSLPLTAYEEALMAYPAAEAAQLARIRATVLRDAGRAVPLVMTEYGQTVRPMPKADPGFILSLDESLLVADQLRAWIEARLPLAEKYLLTSSPFLATDPSAARGPVLARAGKVEGVPEFDPGLAIGSAMIAGPGPRFVREPGALAFGLMARLAGERLLGSATRNVPVLPLSGAPALQVVAGAGRHVVRVAVINDSPVAGVRAAVDLRGLATGRRLSVEVLDGPSASAYNTALSPDAVGLRTRRLSAPSGVLKWTFPAHSLTLLTWS